MKSYLVLLCFIGVVPATLLQTVFHRYYVIMNKVTWSDAQSYCRKTYTDLATVNSSLDWLRLKEEVARKGLTDVAWVGLYNVIDSWRWCSNNVQPKDSFQQWNTDGGQPDNYNGQELCGLTGPLGYWWDYPCIQLFPFICFNENNTDAGRFIGFTTTMSWNDAQAYCRKFYTDLATVTSATENSMTQRIALSQGKSWMGLYRDSWKWSDGTNALNLLWNSGQPDNYFKNENCAVLNNRMLMFDDKQCESINYFICHGLPHRMQIVKLQVKSDESILNSDVQSAILEVIKQKLEETGMMGNIAVTWRVQSNGQICNRNVIET